MERSSTRKGRSGCPVSIGLEQFGDRWSLLIIRDLMVRGYRTFREFLNAGEGISTSVLSDRLRKLVSGGIVSTEPDQHDARRIHYRLTQKGIALAPMMLELLLWAGRWEETAAPCGFVEQMDKNRQAVLAETYRRWEHRDPTPLIPPFLSPAKSPRRKSTR